MTKAWFPAFLTCLSQRWRDCDSLCDSDTRLECAWACLAPALSGPWRALLFLCKPCRSHCYQSSLRASTPCLWMRQQILKSHLLEHPWQSSGQDTTFLLQGTWVPFLARELRIPYAKCSQKLEKKKKKPKITKLNFRWIEAKAFIFQTKSVLLNWYAIS